MQINTAHSTPERETWVYMLVPYVHGRAAASGSTPSWCTIVSLCTWMPEPPAPDARPARMVVRVLALRPRLPSGGRAATSATGWAGPAGIAQAHDVLLGRLVVAGGSQRAAG